MRQVYVLFEPHSIQRKVGMEAALVVFVVQDKSVNSAYFFSRD